MMLKRVLNGEFMEALKEGVLKPLLDRVRADHTLMMALRGTYINIYYRGGSLYKITQNGDEAYTVTFDTNYNVDKSAPLPIAFPFSLSSHEAAAKLVSAIPDLKSRIDQHHSIHVKPEREFQQLVVRENNHASETHYFIVDIEVAGVLNGARFDMLAIRWLSHERGRPATVVPVLIEMKYNVDALDGASGLEKHLKDAYALKAQEATWDQLLVGLEEQLNQLNELKLLTFNQSSKFDGFEVLRNATPELIFILAGHNPGSSKLKNILAKIVITDADRTRFDLLFSVSTFAGYSMYREAMLNLEEFKIEVSRLLERAIVTRRRVPGLDVVET